MPSIFDSVPWIRARWVKQCGDAKFLRTPRRSGRRLSQREAFSDITTAAATVPRSENKDVPWKYSIAEAWPVPQDNYNDELRAKQQARAYEDAQFPDIGRGPIPKGSDRRQQRAGKVAAQPVVTNNAQEEKVSFTPWSTWRVMQSLPEGRVSVVRASTKKSIVFEKLQEAEQCKEDVVKLIDLRNRFVISKEVTKADVVVVYIDDAEDDDALTTIQGMVPKVPIVGFRSQQFMNVTVGFTRFSPKHAEKLTKNCFVDHEHIQDLCEFLGEQRKKPNFQDVRTLARQRQLELGDALAISLVGQVPYQSLVRLCDQAKIEHVPLKLHLWLDLSRCLRSQFLAAALILKHQLVELTLKGCSIDVLADICDLNQSLCIVALNLRVSDGIEDMGKFVATPFLETLDFSGWTGLKRVKGLLNNKTRLKYINFRGCNSLDLEDLWQLTLEMGKKDGVIVWPSYALLCNAMQAKSKSSKQEKSEVMRVALAGVEKQMHHAAQIAVNEKDLIYLQHAREYAQEFNEEIGKGKSGTGRIGGFNIDPGEYLNIKLRALLSKDDCLRLRKLSGKSLAKKFQRAVHVARWLDIQPPADCLSAIDLEQTLNFAGFQCTAESARGLMSGLDTKGKGSIGLDGLQLLSGDYKGPATLQEAIDFWHDLQMGFDGIDKALAQIFTKQGQRLNLPMLIECLDSKMSPVSHAMVMSMIKVLGLRCSDSLVSEEEIKRMTLLRGLSSYVHLELFTSAVEAKFGSLQSAFKKVDENQSDALSYDEFQSVCSTLHKKGMMKFHNDELRAMWLLLDITNDGSVSRTEFTSLAVVPRGADIIRDLRALLAAVERHFTSSNPIDEAFWTPVAMETGIDGKTLDSHQLYLMSFKCFEKALDSYGFVSKALPLQDLFNNIFDRTRCGKISFQDWQLLDFLYAERQRGSLEGFQAFVKAKYRDADAAFASLLIQQRRAVRKRRNGRA
eukprot:gnl/MRDRNA2_/MRDRNA2_120768_c0_seq1.p1 gnl/MRDRNA2_/MRDRNA2_120768_c0~~gnl/MRDRNA2_/MRDRNA2_120768_c0_seq1.p1  ORF type:complete len:958 (+),score=172.68 gnl/MRDRNA2_/MRDRNA2_120768_c0_seq1:100-2973(+)